MLLACWVPYLWVFFVIDGLLGSKKDIILDITGAAIYWQDCDTRRLALIGSYLFVLFFFLKEFPILRGISHVKI